MESKTLREPVRVLMHLNGGFTKVILERTIGVGLADFGIEWEIPTASIPLHLRAIGARFLLITPAGRRSDSDDELRAARYDIVIEELQLGAPSV